MLWLDLTLPMDENENKRKNILLSKYKLAAIAFSRTRNWIRASYINTSEIIQSEIVH